MKIDINKIDEGRFVIREKIDYEYVKQLAQSLLEDGQWDPIIVRPKEGGRYEKITNIYSSINFFKGYIHRRSVSIYNKGRFTL